MLTRLFYHNLLGTQSLTTNFQRLSEDLSFLLESNPREAIRKAREIKTHAAESKKLKSLQAAILVDGGTLADDRGAVEEGVGILRDLHAVLPVSGIKYNLANGILALVGNPPRDSTWVDHQERTREFRAEIRQLLWHAARDEDADYCLRTTAWTNLANQFSNSFRLSEAHDARMAALKADPENGVAAGSAAKELLWLYRQGGCSELTLMEATMLAKLALQHEDRIIQYAGNKAAVEIAEFAKGFDEPPQRSSHTDPFIEWLENERLTLSPAVELVDPALGKLDWLTLPGIIDRTSEADGRPPAIFAMFNVLKSDFILARDLAWRARDEDLWPKTGRFADTLDYAEYGPDSSALALAHRTALDLLDKIAVTANHYFGLGRPPNRVSFGRLWRRRETQKSGILPPPLTKAVDETIRSGVGALYGLVELADDYASKDGILHSQQNLRNAGTHRFVVLHDLEGSRDRRKIPEIEHLEREEFTQEVLKALRAARSGIQMLALAVSQHQRVYHRQSPGMVFTQVVPDHDWVRGRQKSTDE